MRSQRRLVSPFSEVSLQPNTFIGGVSPFITTASNLASRLGILATDIPYFAIVGDDVEAKITATYSFNWRDEPDLPDSLSYYIDLGARCTYNSGWTGFYKITRVELTGCTDIEVRYAAINSSGSPVLNSIKLAALAHAGNQKFQCYSNSVLKELHLPNCITFGSSPSTLDGVFSNIPVDCKVYLPSSAQTSNGGVPDPDVQYLIDRGCDVRFITNNTAPNAITNLSIGTKYATGLQLNFTPPSSVNTIEFYECYANGVKKNNISASGGYITGLQPNTPYNIIVKAVDIYYNKSEFSNSVNDTTSATYVIPTANISNYYRFNDDLTDSVGTNNGTGTAINYAAGKSGNAASFNGTTSNISFTQMLQAIPSQSISCFVKSNENSRQQRIFGLSNGAGTPFLMLRIGTSLNRIECNVYDASPQVFIGTNYYDITLWNHIVVTMVNNNNWKVYVNGNLVATRVLGYYVVITGGNRLGSDRNGGTTVSLNGQIDGVATWNKELSQVEISEIYSKQNAGEELI